MCVDPYGKNAVRGMSVDKRESIHCAPNKINAQTVSVIEIKTTECLFFWSCVLFVPKIESESMNFQRDKEDSYLKRGPFHL